MSITDGLPADTAAAIRAYAEEVVARAGVPSEEQLDLLRRTFLDPLPETAADQAA